jgi:hypothetical protein
MDTANKYQLRLSVAGNLVSQPAAGARSARPSCGSGHRTIACRAPGCEWTVYEPPYEPES